MTGRLALSNSLSTSLARVLPVFWQGDSQTAPTPSFLNRAEMTCGPRFADYLRSMGLPVRMQTEGTGGWTSADFLTNAHIMWRWGKLWLAVLYGGVNDPMRQAVPSIAAATAGTINTSAGAQWYAIGIVLTLTNGMRLAQPMQAVQLAVGATGSITLGAVALDATVAKQDFYISPAGFATQAAALLADNRVMVQTVAGNTGGTASITAISGAAAKMPSVSTRANLQAWAKIAQYRIRGALDQIYLPGASASAISSLPNVVADQTLLPAYAPIGCRIVVMDDTSATGGIGKDAWADNLHATIAGDLSGAGMAQQAVWERRTAQGGERGWGRVAIGSGSPLNGGLATPVFSTGCGRVVIVSTNYENWPAGNSGDNVNTRANGGSGFAYQEGTSTTTANAPQFYAPYVDVRRQQLLAATNEGAVFANLFDFQSQMIANGETTQGSASWHVAPTNQHHEEFGHETVPRCVVTSIGLQKPLWFTEMAQAAA